MKRRGFLGTALAGLPVTGAFAEPPKPKAGDIPTTTLGRTGVEVQVIAQGGACMDWNGQSEEAYGRGLQGVRKHVFLTSKSVGRTAKDAEKDLETSLPS